MIEHNILGQVNGFAGTTKRILNEYNEKYLEISFLWKISICLQCIVHFIS